MQIKQKEEYEMDNYVIGEEENYSDFIKEIIYYKECNNKCEEVLLEEDMKSRKITTEDYDFLAK